MSEITIPVPNWLSNITLPGAKTYIAAAFSAGFAIYGYWHGLISVDTAAQLISTSAIGGALRADISKAIAIGHAHQAEITRGMALVQAFQAQQAIEPTVQPVKS